MFKRKLALVVALAAVLLTGATAAVARERSAAARHGRGLKALGLKAYGSLLREDQKPQAREIVGDHLVATAPDRLAAAARLLRFKADVAALLTPTQRRAAARLAWRTRRMDREHRETLLQRLLDATDRDALARRVQEHAAAAPEEKVRIGLEILDQAYEAVEPKLAETLELSRAQRSDLRTLYEGLKEDLRPVAVRLETARAESIRQGLALLDAGQRTKLEEFREQVTGKVLAFLRG